MFFNVENVSEITASKLAPWLQFLQNQRTAEYPSAKDPFLLVPRPKRLQRINPAFSEFPFKPDSNCLSSQPY
jgi:hypothetical protein